MLSLPYFLGLLLALVPASPVQEPANPDAPFPASSALAEGVSPDVLAILGDLVQGFVDDEEIVGAELLVIKNGRSILHEAYGWRDRETQTAMETGSVFCVRSMTKPLIGASILMLVDDRKVKLGDHVAEYLPSFDVEGTRNITIEHLLSHTSGLPMSLLLGKNLRDLDGIQAVANLGAGYELDFEPGSAFSYSDQGTDTLTALIEVVSGMSAAEFVNTRLLGPLGMQGSACVMAEDHPLRSRGCVKYGGSRGAWTRFWGPDEPPLFPFFLGSQGLYSTLQDYGRFMEFWRRKGRPVKERLLGARFVRRALTPGPHPMKGPTGLPGLHTAYGYLMQLWTESGEEGEDEVVAFGHTGSDGTHAWVFPEQKAMVFYFTQSRGNHTGIRVEEVLGELFLGVPYDTNEAAPPFEQYLGYYMEDDENDLYRAIIRDGKDMALEIMGKGVVPLTYVGEDRWKLRPNPSEVLAFDRSEAGEVTGFHVGDHQEFRFDPSLDLPDIDEVAAQVAKFHRIDLLESLGPLRLSGAVTIEKQNITGEMSTLLAWPNRIRVDSEAAGQFERYGFDGEAARTLTSMTPLTVHQGERAEMLRLDSPLGRYGDWRHWYPDALVIQQIEGGGKKVLLVRTSGTSSPARTLYIDLEKGGILAEDSLTVIGALGRIGQHVEYGDYRDVEGMMLPFRTEIEFPHPLIGTIVTTVTSVELDVELHEGVFELGE
ncbi:MAG TPA: class A beta-lactamase-related serine hydrolase [Planctomycetes bacterium]|nr:class A beta-lactamase-related serine hydrolase [Planctomycetota bacterium]HIL38520.1 class A beta-lactamase-related serine hydrolase [Planctomycetota bacterium]